MKIKINDLVLSGLSLMFSLLDFESIWGKLWLIQNDRFQAVLKKHFKQYCRKI